MKQDYLDAIDQLVKVPEPPFTTQEEADNKEKAFDQAIAKHSLHGPLVVIEDMTSDGTDEYALSGLTSWDAERSEVTDVEYPINDGEITKYHLDAKAYLIYEKPSGKFLIFETTPTSGENFRVTYTTSHTVSDVTDTILAKDVKPLECLVASYYCAILAAAYASNEDDTIKADSVNHASKRREYQKQAEELFRRYGEHMNLLDDKPKPAYGTANWDFDFMNRWDRLTHPNRYR
jgi:hypothetical protein